MADGGFEDAKLALKALISVVTVFSKSLDPKPTPFSGAVKKMGADAHVRAMDLKRELMQMEKDLAGLRDMGFNVDLPLPVAKGESWFYKFGVTSPYRLIRNFNSRVASITMQCELLFSDIVSVANCREAEEELAGAAKQAAETYKQIQASVDKDAAMSKVVEQLRIESEKLVQLSSGF